MSACRKIVACALCSCSCCTCLLLLGLASWHLVVRIVFPYRSRPASLSPGALIRKSLQPDILKALKTGDWAQLDRNYRDWGSALIIGDASGPRWCAERGWMSLNKDYAIASQTKLITALTIYRLIVRNSSALSPTTLVSRYITSWPSDPGQPGSNVSLEHLLAFTTGFEQLHFGKPGCARQTEYRVSWAECVEEIAAYKFQYPPGESFQYGPWHMVVAAAMAQLAFGKPLTADAWTRTVSEEVFKPVGIWDLPDYAGVRSDQPQFPVGLGGGTRSQLRQQSFFPDFSGGLRMSGWQWQEVIHKLQFGGLLPAELFQQFIADHVVNVTKVLGVASRGGLNTMGSWHYAQGEWISCDAVLEDQPMTWEEANAKCGGGANQPEPQVLHSVGAYGFYVWMDLTNKYYGVFVHSWVVELTQAAYILTPSCAALGLCVGIFSAWWCCLRQPDGVMELEEKSTSREFEDDCTVATEDTSRLTDSYD